MAWTTPKTDWKAQFDGTGYIGDWVLHTDYNRIKNNVAYIFALAPKIKLDSYPTMGADKTVTDYPRASEWNAIENALHQLAVNISGSFSAKLFYDNGFTPDFNELNRIENMTAMLKEQYESAIANNYRMKFTLGQDRNVLRM